MERLFEELRAMRGETSAAHGETRRHFEVAVERIENSFQSLAESVANLDEKFERKTEALDERMRRGFDDTQAMIKF